MTRRISSKSPRKPDGTPIELTVNASHLGRRQGRRLRARQQALADDTDNAHDVYVKDREAGTLELACRVDPFPDHNEFPTSPPSRATGATSHS